MNGPWERAPVLGIVLGVIGAIMYWAVTASTDGFDINTAGLILVWVGGAPPHRPRLDVDGEPLDDRPPSGSPRGWPVRVRGRAPLCLTSDSPCLALVWQGRA